MIVRVDTDRLRWSVLKRVGMPRTLARISSASVASKLDLVIALRHQGWESGPCVADWKPGCAMTYNSCQPIARLVLHVTCPLTGEVDSKAFRGAAP